MSISFKNYIVDFQKDLICENAYLKGLFMLQKCLKNNTKFIKCEEKNRRFFVPIRLKVKMFGFFQDRNLHENKKIQFCKKNTL